MTWKTFVSTVCYLFIFQEESKNFITEETLEQELEKALDGRADYNFAIDLQGNQYFDIDTRQSRAPGTDELNAKKAQEMPV